MALFDSYIKELNEYIDEMRARGRQVRQYQTSSRPEPLTENQPGRRAGSARPEIILREDTFAELGNPAAGSCAFTLWTENPSLVQDGRISVIGPDIPESSGKSLPFGQVLMLGGATLDNQEHNVLEVTSRLGSKIEGYMVRSATRNIWVRISKKAVAKGFCFEKLGRALIAVYREHHPKITSMEVVFVTTGKDDIGLLDGIAAQVQKIGKEITKKNWEIKGYDIDCSLDCSSCEDKAVCDTIRDVLAKRKSQA